MATEAFGELLHDLNPYVDEIVGPDAFHRFTDLPLELRHMIYDQYFFDETRSVACSKWPDEDGKARISLYTPRGKRWTNSIPFLPNLCFTSHAFGGEAASFLMGSAVSEINTPIIAPFIMNRTYTSHALNKVRELNLRILNKHYHHGLIPHIRSAAQQKLLQTIFDITEKSNKLFNILLSAFSGLRVLHISLRLPCNHFTQQSTTTGSLEGQVVLANKFLVGFDIMPIFNMESLEQLMLYASTHGKGDLGLDVDQVHPFAAVKELGLTIKAEFKELNRDVEVRVFRCD